MRMRTIYASLNIILLLIAGIAQGATPEKPDYGQESQPKHMVSFLPIYMTVNAIRIDYDFSLSKQHWIQVAPLLFLRNNTMQPYPDDYDFLRLAGGGIHLYHKFYPKGKYFDRANVYISYGPIYQNLHFTYNENSGNDVIERYTHLHRIGGDVIIGVTAPIFDMLMLDFYAGMGVRHSLIESNATRPQRFNDYTGDYGYSGNTILLGLRLSVPFK